MGAGGSLLKRNKGKVHPEQTNSNTKDIDHINKTITEAWIKHKNETTLDDALSFMPLCLQMKTQEGVLAEGRECIVVEDCEAAVVFSDASGFTALTEALSKKSNGAELLSKCLNMFFTPLINLITAYRGDVIKFSGDALTIIFPANMDDSSQHPYPCGSPNCPGHTNMELAVLRASACCIEIHKRLHNFVTGVEKVGADGQMEQVLLTLHIGVGAGRVKVLQVGGETPPQQKVGADGKPLELQPQYEYIVAGEPLEQISIAEPLASSGETVLSPQAWKHVEEYVVEGDPIAEQPTFKRLKGLQNEFHTYPTVKTAAQKSDTRYLSKLRPSQMAIPRRYIPRNAWKQIENGTLSYVNEMRNASVIFIQVAGLKVEESPELADLLMKRIQKRVFAHEGTVNKMLVDDKGLLFLCAFGLPPLVHTDDPIRAVLACKDMRKDLMRFNLTGRFGVTTSRVFCGVVGSHSRQEYTTLGDTVNLSARLMAYGKNNDIWVCDNTYAKCEGELIFDLNDEISVKGKTIKVKRFRFKDRKHPTVLGLDDTLPSDLTMETVRPLIKHPWLRSKSNMKRLNTWSSLEMVKKMLGAKSNADAFMSEDSVDKTTSQIAGKQPTDKFLEWGGAFFCSGRSGRGKVELVEYIVESALMSANFIPIYASCRARPGTTYHPVLELVKSCCQAWRITHKEEHAKILSACPSPPVAATEGEEAPPVQEQLVPDTWQILKTILKGNSKLDQHIMFFATWISSEGVFDISYSPEHDEFDLPPAGGKGEGKPALRPKSVNRDHMVSACIDLLEATADACGKGLVLTMRMHRGNSVYTEFDESTFWTLCSAVGKFVQTRREQCKTSGKSPVVLAVVCRDGANEAAKYGASGIIQWADKNGWWRRVAPFTDVTLKEYVSLLLKVKPTEVPEWLNEFLREITLMNPRSIRETIDHLLGFSMSKVKYLAVTKDSTYIFILNAHKRQFLRFWFRLNNKEWTTIFCESEK